MRLRRLNQLAPITLHHFKQHSLLQYTQLPCQRCRQMYCVNISCNTITETSHSPSTDARDLRRRKVPYRWNIKPVCYLPMSHLPSVLATAFVFQPPTVIE